ncbi:hypothetical protein NC651_026397 [Populus alba x Populus x berolinensis]|nr:hypothetical protein NC651_026397 [Populus alba x Populus x berolinensis]
MGLSLSEVIILLHGPEQNAFGQFACAVLISGIFPGVVLDWLWLIGKNHCVKPFPLFETMAWFYYYVSASTLMLISDICMAGCTFLLIPFCKSYMKMQKDRHSCSYDASYFIDSPIELEISVSPYFSFS